MFLGIIILLQTCLPCTECFSMLKNVFKDKNYQATQSEIQKIASPRLMSKLSPISAMHLNLNQIKSLSPLQSQAIRKQSMEYKTTNTVDFVDAVRIANENLKDKTISKADKTKFISGL